LRLKGFFNVLLKNRMALTGILMLSFFVLLGVAAPSLTPYRPQGDIVSGARDAPAWVTLFNGQTGYSQNIEFSGPSVRGAGLSVTSRGPDSVVLNVTSATGGTMRLLETLAYPYDGPPARFLGDVSITPELPVGAAAFVNMSLVRYVNGQQSGNWTLWPAGGGRVILNTTNTYTPFLGIDSYDQGLKQSLGFGTSALNTAAIIFPKPGLFYYVMDITVPSGRSSYYVQDFRMRILGNTWGLLGTDDGGEDIWSQFVYGARLSLIVGITATLIGISLGLLVGLLAGYLGKLVDEVLMRFTDMMLVIPQLPLLIVLVAVLGQSLFNIILVLGFLGWPGFARLIRSQVLSLRERPFIEAAKASGAGTGYITARHIFPNIVSLTYVNLALYVPAAIVGEAALSFLGLGDTSVITWGRMLEFFAESGGSTTNILWWWIFPPGLGIALLSLSFILLGFAMDEIFNPKLRRRR
jgi:peptide/nickel transport system permease protein